MPGHAVQRTACFARLCPGHDGRGPDRAYRVQSNAAHSVQSSYSHLQQLIFKQPCLSNSHVFQTAMSFKQPCLSNSHVFQTAMSFKQPCLSNSHASSPVLFGKAPGRPVFPFSLFSSSPKRGGWRAKGRNHCSLCARIPSRKYGAPLGAPPGQACVTSPGPICWRLPCCAGAVAFPFRPSRPQCDGLRQPAPGGRPLLAARRSPGAARVRALRGTPAGAASCSTIRRL